MVLRLFNRQAVVRGRAMSITSYDLTFRPTDYFAVPETVFASIKGEARRRAVREAIEQGAAERLPAVLLRDSLPAALRSLLCSRFPRLMGGETLPDCEPGEVEIARVTYPSTVLSDVMSFRARRVRNHITFRAVTDNADELVPGQKRAWLPLTMAKLVRLIERTGQGVAFWASHLAAGTGPADLPPVEVSSAFYPELDRYYGERASRWLRRRCGQWGEPATTEHLDVIRRGLLWRLNAEDRQRGITRPEKDRCAAVERFIRLRFMV